MNNPNSINNPSDHRKSTAVGSIAGFTNREIVFNKHTWKWWLYLYYKKCIYEHEHLLKKKTNK